MKIPKIKSIRYFETRRGLGYQAKTNYGSIWNDGNGGCTYFDADTSATGPGHRNCDFNHLDDDNALERLIDVFENCDVECPGCCLTFDSTDDTNRLGYCEDCQEKHEYPLMTHYYECKECSEKKHEEPSGRWEEEAECIPIKGEQNKSQCPGCKEFCSPYRSTLK